MRIESVGKGGVAANVDGEIAKYGRVKCVDIEGAAATAAAAVVVVAEFAVIA